MNLKLFNVNNCECLFDLIELRIKKSCSYECNHLGILKLNNKSYNIIVSNFEVLKIFDLNGNKLNDNYINTLNIENVDELILIDTYYDQKLCNNYFFFSIIIKKHFFQLIIKKVYYIRHMAKCLIIIYHK